jgi:hypothetical protein
MSSATLTSPPPAMTRLGVDTDVASFIFKWHPKFAALYVSIVQGFDFVVSFMTVAEMRQGALDAKWGPRKSEMLEGYAKWVRQTPGSRPLPSCYLCRW